jgi:trimeric autotransporter adhesin
MMRYTERQPEKTSRRAAITHWLSASLFCSFVMVTGSAHAQITLPGPGIINTVAGNGTAGFSGDGGAATSAELDQPRDVAVDAAGNIYLADDWNSRIRKVTASTGKISTVAGNGTRGYSGDGGAATSAELNFPSAVAVDTGGNIYIVDYSNDRIRKVTASTSKISTVAGNGTEGYSGDGGAATSAELTWPEGVAVDTAGNIYIADCGNNRIRKVTASTGIISTVAGNGTRGYSGDGGAATSAKLYCPYGMAVDTSGNIYIADTYNSVIRKVTASTGDISTVAGTGTAGYSGDGGAATSAELNGPVAVAMDAAGNIYIADISNERIRKVTASTGDISTVAGTGAAGYSGDGGAATSAKIYNPYGVAVDTANNIYIADKFNNRVRAVGHP